MPKPRQGTGEDAPVEEGQLEAVMAALGYQFADPALLRTALTHASFPALHSAQAQDNQRLEFLGDAALELCVSEALYHRFPAMREGELTQMRIAFVRTETLGAAGKRLRLGEALRMAPAERTQGVDTRVSVLADTFEAVLAAIYLDGGFGAASAFVARTLDVYHAPVEDAEHNWKSLLQEAMQAAGDAAPTYALVRKSGPPHEPAFTAAVCGSHNRILAEGEGRSKKEAEQDAARQAYTLFTAAREPLQQEDAAVATEEA